jgi:putative isomerase
VIEGYVLNPEHFWSDHGIRSMSRSDLAYNNAIRGITLPMRVAGPTGPGINNRSSNWQGPIWSITNYLVALALKRYGYAREAQQVAERVIRVYAASVREHGSCYENYHAETGEPLCAPSVGSWNLMLRHLPGHLDGDIPWLLKDLRLPTAD